MGKRRFLAGVVLVCAGLLADATVLRLNRRNGQVPDRFAPYGAAFAAAFGLAMLAGATAPAADGKTRETNPGPLARGSVAVRIAAGAAAVGFFAWTWILQGLPEPPLTCLLTWAAAMGLAIAAFPGLGRRTGDGGAARRSAGAAAALAAVLLLAGSARLIRLDAVLPVFSGDEASVATDGINVLRRQSQADPFGTGPNSSMHLGMLPAGAGAILFADSVAGPRLPYAVIGTFAVAATAVAAGLLSGFWAALAAAALIAFAPIHVHFSRSSNTVVLDSLIVTLAALFLLALLRGASPRYAYLTGLLSGLALYGYGGGRVMPVVLLLSLPLLFWRFRRFPRRSAGLLAALVVGFFLAAGPNLRFAAKHFDEWNGRFNQASVFSAGWRHAEVARLGSERRVLESQIRLGTLGLLSAPPLIDIFTGYPPIAPALLPAMGLVGLGWLLGRRRLAEATILALVVGGNIAGVVLTVSTPQAHRASSLVPMLAILGGVATAGFLKLLPGKAAGVSWRGVAGTLLVGAFLGRCVSGFPLDWEGYGEAGGPHAAFAQSASFFLRAPRYRAETVFFHGAPALFWDFPSFRYFLPGRTAENVREVPAQLPPGLHLCAEEFLEQGKLRARALGIRHGILLPHPAFPRRDVGFVFFVPPGHARPDRGQETS